jgi:hypothetical protein
MTMATMGIITPMIGTALLAIWFGSTVRASSEYVVDVLDTPAPGIRFHETDRPAVG